MRYLLILFTTTICVVPVSAGVTLFTTEVAGPNSRGPTGFVTNDFKIDFTGQYTGSQLLLGLTTGSIYQDLAGTAVPPNSANFAGNPTLEFDTFVAQGSLSFGGLNGEPSAGGGAVNLGGAAAPQFDTAGIDQAWFPAGGQNIRNQTGFLTARVTLTNDASGTFSYQASAGGQITQYHGFVTNGVITAVPEPSACLFLGLLGLALGVHQFFRRRGGQRSFL